MDPSLLRISANDQLYSVQTYTGWSLDILVTMHANWGQLFKINDVVS